MVTSVRHTSRRLKSFALLSLLIVGTLASFGMSFLKVDTAAAADLDSSLNGAARSWLLMSFFARWNSYNYDGSKSLSNDDVKNIGYIPESGSARDCWYHDVGWLLETSHGKMAVDSQFLCIDGGGPGADTAPGTIDNVLGSMGYNRQSFVQALGFTQQPDGTWKGGNFNTDTLTKALTKSQGWPASITGGDAAVTSGAIPGWVQYADLVQDIQKGNCTAAGLTQFPDPNGNISLVGSDGVATRYKVVSTGNSVQVAMGYISCDEVIKRLSPDLANSYIGIFSKVNATKANSCDTKYSGQANLVAACAAGYGQKQTDPTADPTKWCTAKYPGDQQSIDACVFGFTKATAASAPTTSNPNDAQKAPSCNPNLGLGWLLCPVVNFLAGIGDSAKSFIDSAMTVDTSQLLPLAGTANAAWAKMRDIANVLFVIAFLFMIYSQLTGFGLSNYSIKKMLPRLAMVALLINASYYLCVGAVEISNVVGQGVDHLISAGKCGSLDTSCIPVQVPKNTAMPDNVPAGLAGWGLTALAAGLTAYFFLPQVIAVIVYVAFIAMSAAVMLGLRQALIILLVIVSPIAFAANLLPNTEGLFKKWWGIFKALLYLYPIFGLLYGAGKLAASILGGIGGDSGWIFGLFGYIALFSGLLILPKLLEGALAVGGFAAIVGKMRNGAHGFTKDKMEKGRFGEMKQAYEARGMQRRVNRRMGNGTLARWGRQRQADGKRGGAALAFVGSMGSKFDNTRAGQFFGGDRGQAAAVSQFHHATGEEVERQQSLLSEKSADELLKTMYEGKGTVQQRAAVVRQLAKVGGDQHVQAAYDYLSKNHGQKDVGDIQQLASKELLSRKPAGVGTSQANALLNGKLGEGNNASYKDMFKRRVQEGAFGAKEFASMGKDDLIRLAEMSKAGTLSQPDLDKMKDTFEAIGKDETLKGTMTGERQALFDSILAKSGPRKVDGSAHTLTPL